MGKLTTSFPELIFNVLLLVLGFIIMAGSVKLGFASLREPGAGLFPFFSGLAIFISECILLLNSIFGRDGTGPVFLKRNDVKTLTIFLIIFASWIVVMPFLGYIPVTFLTAFAIAKVMGLKGWMKPFLLSVGTSVFAYVLFDWLLYLDLPRGLLG